MILSTDDVVVSFRVDRFAEAEAEMAEECERRSFLEEEEEEKDEKTSRIPMKKHPRVPPFFKMGA